MWTILEMREREKDKRRGDGRWRHNAKLLEEKSKDEEEKRYSIARKSITWRFQENPKVNKGGQHRLYQHHHSTSLSLIILLLHISVVSMCNALCYNANPLYNNAEKDLKFGPCFDSQSQ